MLNFLAFVNKLLLFLDPELFKSKEIALLLGDLIISINTMTKVWH
jgi:hypothetical protein